MLNSVSDHSEAAAPVRRRLSADERRRQLVAIGLAKIVETTELESVYSLAFTGT